jgi:hypothetical protein
MWICVFLVRVFVFFFPCVSLFVFSSSSLFSSPRFVHLLLCVCPLILFRCSLSCWFSFCGSSFPLPTFLRVARPFALHPPLSDDPQRIMTDGGRSKGHALCLFRAAALAFLSCVPAVPSLRPLFLALGSSLLSFILSHVFLFVAATFGPTFPCLLVLIFGLSKECKGPLFECHDSVRTLDIGDARQPTALPTPYQCPFVASLPVCVFVCFKVPSVRCVLPARRSKRGPCSDLCPLCCARLPCCFKCSNNSTATPTVCSVCVRCV